MSRRINQLLDSLERSSTLSEDGRAWLIAAVDPFHDADLKLAGYPSLATGGSIVQLVKQQLQLSVPLAGNGIVTAGQNWDCSIVMFPNLNNTQIQSSSAVNIFGALSPGVTTNGISQGGITVSAAPQGVQLWPTATFNSGSVSVTNSSLNVLPYIKGPSRVIAMGFEVVNTTAPLTKQGQVTCWRQPVDFTPSQYSGTVATTPAVVSNITFLNTKYPPATLATAMLLDGSLSWDAAEGAYVVGRQNESSNPPKMPSFQRLAYVLGDLASGVNDTIHTSSFINGTPLELSDLYCPFDQSGAYFTGLSYTTTLTINYRVYIERFPSSLEPDLVVLATPTCILDELALEIYMHALTKMPPGCMLKENPLGEWFTKALTQVAEWAPKIGMGLAGVHPAAPMIGNLVGKLSNKVAKKVAKSKLIPLPDSRSKLNHSSTK